MTPFMAGMIGKLRQQFPAGTPVVVKGGSKTGRATLFTFETVGTVVDWRHEPTGAWYAKSGDPNTANANGKLLLCRLRLRKLDGELTDTIIDDFTTIARLEATQA